MTELKGAEDQMSLTILDLDQLLGFGQPASEIQSLLCWGNMGMTGFQGYLTYLIKEGRVKEVMLQVDMAETYACICGNAVDLDERLMGLETAIYCGFEGCKTSWVCC